MELQVACQSAVSQEQVEGMLSENEALRTNLAALEQVQLDRCRPYSSVLCRSHPLHQHLSMRALATLIAVAAAHSRHVRITVIVIQQLADQSFLSWGSNSIQTVLIIGAVIGNNSNGSKMTHFPIDGKLQDVID